MAIQQRLPDSRVDARAPRPHWLWRCSPGRPLLCMPATLRRPCCPGTYKVQATLPAVDASEAPKPGEVAPGPAAGTRRDGSMARRSRLRRDPHAANAPPLPGDISSRGLAGDRRWTPGRIIAAKDPHATPRCPASIIKVLAAHRRTQSNSASTKSVAGTQDGAPTRRAPASASALVAATRSIGLLARPC